MFSYHLTGMKELSPMSITLKKLHLESIATEPVLVLISAGADPSQELQEMAAEVVGIERYHQVRQKGVLFGVDLF